MRRLLHRSFNFGCHQAEVVELNAKSFREQVGANRSLALFLAPECKRQHDEWREAITVATFGGAEHEQDRWAPCARFAWLDEALVVFFHVSWSAVYVTLKCNILMVFQDARLAGARTAKLQHQSLERRLQRSKSPIDWCLAA
eukprot:3161105-Amphidinium_carterae.1